MDWNAAIERNREALKDKAEQCAGLSTSHSRVQLFALRADEELAMAEAVAPLTSSGGRGRAERG